MKDKLFVLGKIISLVVFLFVLSLMGLVTKQPVMMLVYAGFFAVVMLGFFLIVRLHQRHFEIVGGANKKIVKLIGLIVIIAALLLPIFIFQMQAFNRLSDTRNSILKIKQSINGLTTDIEKLNKLDNTELAKATLLDTLAQDHKFLNQITNDYKAIGASVSELKSSVNDNMQVGRELFDFTYSKSNDKFSRIAKILAEADSTLPDVSAPFDSVEAASKIESTDPSVLAGHIQNLKNSLSNYPATLKNDLYNKIGNIGSGFTILILINSLFMLLIWAALIAACVLGVYLINHKGNKIPVKILGYLIIILISAVPALLVIPYDKTSTGIGSMYWVAVLVAVIAWWGFSLFLNKE